MSYCTQADLEALLPDARLTGLTSETGSVDTDVVALAVVAASSEVDGYLCGRYTTPVTDTAVLAILKVHAARLAVRTLYARRILKSLPQGFDEVVKDSVTFLRDIQTRKADLPAVTPTSSGSISSAAAFGSGDQVFGDGVML